MPERWTAPVAVAAAATALLAAACGGDDAREAVTVPLKSSADAASEGTAVVTRLDQRRTRVEVELRRAGGPHPAHIHLRSCADTGAPWYKLADVTGGVSESIVGPLAPGTTYKVEVHASRADDTVIACGVIPNVAR